MPANGKTTLTATFETRVLASFAMLRCQRDGARFGSGDCDGARDNSLGRRCDQRRRESPTILAEPPSDLAVTVYRAPYRSKGSIDLNDLGGFALVSETRTVHLPAGLSRVRFEGVADGIESASAIVTGLPGRVVIEKNRDARLLSPAALVAPPWAKQWNLLRTNRKTGKTESVRGTIRSDAGRRGVSVREGYRGAALFGSAGDLQFRTGRRPRRLSPLCPSLVQSSSAVTAQVTLSYLAHRI